MASVVTFTIDIKRKNAANKTANTIQEKTLIENGCRLLESSMMALIEREDIVALRT